MNGAKRHVLSLAVLIFVISMPHPTSGQSAFDTQLAKVTTIHVEIIDDVDNDNCVSDPNTLRTQAEFVLRRSGIAVGDEGDLNHDLLISINGRQLQNGSCVVSYRVALWRFETLFDSSVGLVLSFEEGGVMGGPPSNLQDRLRSQVDQSTTALANEILNGNSNIDKTTHGHNSHS